MMIPRISSIKALPDCRLFASFDDGKRVIYDVKTDLNLPGYCALVDIPGLFDQAQLDKSRTCVYWNDEIDLPSDTIYEYGQEISNAESVYKCHELSSGYPRGD